MGQQREIWFDGRNVSFERQDIWGLVNTSPIRKVLITLEQRQKEFFPQKTELITEIDRVEDLEQIATGETVFSANQDLLDVAKERGYRTCVFFSVDNAEQLERSWREAIRYDYAAVDFDLPTNIPLELIIARLDGRDTVLLRQARTFVDMEVAFGCLEKGSDGVLLSAHDPQEIAKVSQFLNSQTVDWVPLHTLTVTEVEHIGMGVRACVDTTGLMTQDEGMLIGSTSSGGIFVCSETHYLPYMNLRPFRVNAGAIHSYIWQPDDKAEYLSELKAGSKVLCVNTKGEARILTVGRIKTEVRPLLLIKGIASGTEINVIVQDDWHIRIMGADGKPKNASLIQPGDELLAYVCEPGRHVGIKVNESILER